MIGVFDSVLCAIFSPLLALPFPLFILSMAAIVSLINALTYKLLLDHEKMRSCKKRIKELQERAQKLQKENPERAEEVMKEMFPLMNQQMMLSLKPMLVSTVFILLFLPFISHVSMQSVELKNGKGVFEIGVFTKERTEIPVRVENDSVAFDMDKDGVFEKRAKIGETVRLGSTLWRVNGAERERVYLGAVVKLPFPVPFFSYGFGWLMWYIVCSTFLIYLFRRIFGIEY